MSLFDMTGDELLPLVEDWWDPFPDPVIETHGNIHIVRDDLLGVGSKVRFIDKLIRDTDCDEWVYGGSTKMGFGPVSLAHVCKKYGKKAVIFMAKRKTPTEYQQKAIDEGAEFKWLDFGMLTVCQKRAKDYVEADPIRRKMLPMGLEHPWVFASIVKVARNLKIDMDQIDEVWSVGGSGTLNRGLQLAWPDKMFSVVQIGHKMTDREIGIAKHYVAPYAYDKPVDDEKAPPFQSNPYYDAKGWEFINEYGEKNCLFWNVA